jgi:hypothetical protein
MPDGMGRGVVVSMRNYLLLAGGGSLFAGMIMKRLPILAVLALAGCATAVSVPTKYVVDGIDVWKGGNPSQPYTVMDTVQSVGPDTSATYEQEEQQIAQEAKERGADGIIVLNTVMVISRQDVALDRPIMAPKVQAELIKYQ